jgi:hypothetical protein
LLSASGEQTGTSSAVAGFGLFFNRGKRLKGRVVYALLCPTHTCVVDAENLKRISKQMQQVGGCLGSAFHSPVQNLASGALVLAQERGSSLLASVRLAPT